MTGHIITLRSGDSSRAGAKALFASHKEVGNSWVLQSFDAITPDGVSRVFRNLGLRWEWPWEEADTCPISGLERHPYKTSNREARIACAASHASLWLKCMLDDAPLMIFEDDAIFTRKLDPEQLLRAVPGGWGAIALNSPLGATRRAKAYQAALSNGPDKVAQCPWVDRLTIPQGLPGASAYLIQPWAARLALRKAREVGMGPNDAILIRQHFPWLGVVRKAYTKVSGRPSGLA